MPFNEAILADNALSWSDFFSTTSRPQVVSAPRQTEGQTETSDDNADVITTATTAADVRNAQELQRRIKAGGGVVVANPNSSDYIVAVNNRLKFSVTRNAGGQFEIRESQNFIYLIAAAVIVGALVLLKK